MNPIPGNGDGVVTTPKSGVALIMVIGLVALMMVMAVAFAIYMRTERVAAGAFRNDVRARQLLHVALARALDGLEANLGDRPYPNWDILSSSGGGGEVSNFTNSPVLDWIPRAMLASGINPRPQWIQVSGGSEQGRVGYMIVNCSGLLDANASGDGVTPRSYGANVSEIQLGACPEVLSLAALVAGRSPNYETIQELGQVGVGSGALSQSPFNFVTYSAFPTNSAEFIGGQRAGIVSNQAAIVQRFVNSGFSSWQAGVLFTNLVDYVDGDIEPGNLGVAGAGNAEGPYVEPVWMINEVYMSNVVWATPLTTNTYSLKGTNYLKVELTFPFVPFVGGAPRNGFSLRYAVTFSNSSIPQLSIPSVSGGPIMIGGGASEFTVPVLPNIATAGGIVTAPLSGNWTISARVQTWVVKAGVVVDSVTNAPLVLPISVSLNLPALAVVPSPATPSVFWGDVDRECCDARRNYDTSAANWAAPRPATLRQTLGTTNNFTFRYWGGSYVSALDRYPGWQAREYDTAAFVKGFGGVEQPLVTVGELGYLFTGDAWRTIRLYTRSNPSADRDPVLDYFTTRTNSVAYERGLVNPNTSNRNVLMAILDQLPIDSPHGTGVNRLSGAGLTAMINDLTALTATNPFVKLSDIGNLDLEGGLSGGNYSELDRESLIRNVAGLLSPRQNYFMIFLFAEATKNVPNLGVSRIAGLGAVAEVWRDPQKNIAGKNPRIIRLLRVLNSD